MKKRRNGGLDDGVRFWGFIGKRGFTIIFTDNWFIAIFSKIYSFQYFQKINLFQYFQKNLFVSIFSNNWNIGGENVAYLLGPGNHEITPINGVEGPGVSLLPIGGRVRSISSTVIYWILIPFYFLIIILQLHIIYYWYIYF